MTPHPLQRLSRAIAGSPASAQVWSLLLVLLIAIVGYLALTPRPPEGVDLGWDKLNHLLAFATLAVCACLSAPDCGARHRWLLVGLLGFGGLIEVVQLFVPGRSAEWSDLLADAIGVAAGAVVAAVVLRAASTPPARSG